MRSKALAIAALAALSASGLAGCGFTPLYGEPGVVSNLSAIEVVTPEGRTGHLIGQYLDDSLGRRHGGTAAWRMDVRLAETRYPRGIRVDNVATRYEYVLQADYALVSAVNGQTAKRGQVRVELTYDSADQPYASITAQQDAQDRAAAEAARRIQMEVAVWLANEAKKG